MLVFFHSIDGQEPSPDQGFHNALTSTAFHAGLQDGIMVPIQQQNQMFTTSSPSFKMFTWSSRIPVGSFLASWFPGAPHQLPDWHFLPALRSSVCRAGTTPSGRLENSLSLHLTRHAPHMVVSGSNFMTQSFSGRKIGAFLCTKQFWEILNLL